MQNTALQDHFYLMKRGRLGNNETPGTLRKKTQQIEGFDLPGDVSNLFAYKISGGLLAGIVGTTIGIALFRWKIPFIAITTIGIGHLVNAGIETFADSYFTHGNEWGLVMGFVEFVTFFSLLIIFDRKTVGRGMK